MMLALQASRKRYANQFARKRWLRPGIVIWPTTVSADPGGMGAFAPAGGLGRGKFIGMYCADNWWRAPIMTPYRGRNKYVMQVGDFRCGPRLKGISKRADTHRFPVMAVQEPPVEGNGKSTANCRKPRASPCFPPLLSRIERLRQTTRGRKAQRARARMCRVLASRSSLSVALVEIDFR